MKGMTLENIRTWRETSKDVRDEVLSTMSLCQDSSEMNDDTHSRHRQYADAYALALRMLDVEERR